MQEEIDLIALFLRLIKFIKQKYIYIITGILIGGIIGVIFYFSQPKIYLYQINAYTPYIKNNIITNCVFEFSSEINTNADETNRELNKIKNIEVETKDENLEIKVITSDLVDIEMVINELGSFLSENQFINKALSFREGQLINAVDFLDNQINKLNNPSSSKTQNFQLKNNEESAATLFIDKMKYKAELEFLRPLVFTNYTPALDQSYSLLICISVGCVLGLILIFGYYFFVKINFLTKKNYINDSQLSFLRESA